MRTASQAFAALILFVLCALAAPAHASPPAESPAADSGEETTPSVDARPWDVPNRCETIKRKAWSKKRERYFYKRDRHKWDADERKRVRSLIKLVADEMGADHEYLWVKSMIESSGNPEVIHILNQDFEANRGSWHRFTWSEQREDQLEHVMETASQRSKRYWRAKAELHRRTKYKGNAYWHDTVEVRIHGPGEDRGTENVSIWSRGYGLYGMNAVYYTEDWDSLAPPWILCADEGIVATVIEIWALRKGLAQCVHAGHPNNWDTANRRVSRGKCEFTEPGPKYVQIAAQVGLDRTARPKLGSKWPRATSDRRQLIDHMRRRAREECLTAELYHRSACTDPKARGYAKHPVDASSPAS